jgi:undecaprenyl diphosphate synthase
MIQHLALIMDGNRRWAKQRGLLPWLGHEQGVQAAQQAIQFCLRKNIKYLSLYAFSLENFNRPAQELDFLFNTLAHQTAKRLPEFLEHGIAIRFIGDWARFPAALATIGKDIQQKTAHLHKLQVNVMFCYGARQEIAAAAQHCAQLVAAGQLDAQDITAHTFGQYLWTGGIPDPDLVIRTGHVQRLSNFLLFQAAYSELYFLDILWPDVTSGHLEQALAFFEQTKRNFGS